MEVDRLSLARAHDAQTAGRPAPHGQSPRDAYRGRVRRRLFVIAGTGAILVVLVVASLLYGSSGLSLPHALAGLFGAGDALETAIVWNVRMPHILCAIVSGCALGIAGCAFQGVLGNPLASPSTIGVSQGAAFGASIAIIAGAGASGAGAAAFDGITFANPALTAACAFIGAMLAAVVILALSRFRDLSPESIVLAGVALSALFSGLTALVQYFADESQVASVVFWTFGSLRRAGYGEIAIMAAVTLACGVFLFMNRWNYNALETGDHSAHGLGVNVRRVRLASMLVGTLAASSAIAFCGTINFIGLVAPHIMRRLIGSDYRFLLPASAIAGAAVLLAADLIAALPVAGVILPISAITSFIGAPLFIYLLVKGVHR